MAQGPCISTRLYGNLVPGTCLPSLTSWLHLILNLARCARISELVFVIARTSTKADSKRMTNRRTG